MSDRLVSLKITLSPLPVEIELRRESGAVERICVYSVEELEAFAVEPLAEVFATARGVP